MLKHLRSIHPKKCLELLPSHGAAASSDWGFFEKMSEPFNPDGFMGKLLKWIVKTDQPFSIVENEHFEVDKLIQNKFLRIPILLFLFILISFFFSYFDS
jgi:hypothetical protein